VRQMGTVDATQSGGTFPEAKRSCASYFGLVAMASSSPGSHGLCDARRSVDSQTNASEHPNWRRATSVPTQVRSGPLLKPSINCVSSLTPFIRSSTNGRLSYHRTETHHRSSCERYRWPVAGRSGPDVANIQINPIASTMGIRISCRVSALFVRVTVSRWNGWPRVAILVESQPKRPSKGEDKDWKDDAKNQTDR
jgi:hypothetical protein